MACAGLVALATAVGCAPAVFECQSDASCGGGNAQCEPVGYCSFPEQDCESGRAYGALAGTLSGQCVPNPEGSTGTTTTTTSSSTATSSTSSASSSSTTGTDTTTVGVSDTSSTSGSPGSTGGDPAGTSGGPVSNLLCPDDMVPIIEETYDALPLSAESWDVFEGEADAAIVDEVLTVSVDLADSSSSAYWWSVSTATIPAAGVAGLELHLVPEPQDPGEIAVGLHDQTRYPFLDVFDGQIYALVREPDDSFTILDAIEWDPDMHRWIRLRWDANADTIDFETSFDAQIWTSFHTMTPTGFDFDQAHYDLGAGAWEGPFSADPFVAFDNAFLCEG